MDSKRKTNRYGTLVNKSCPPPFSLPLTIHLPTHPSSHTRDKKNQQLHDVTRRIFHAKRKRGGGGGGEMGKHTKTHARLLHYSSDFLFRESPLLGSLLLTISSPLAFNLSFFFLNERQRMVLNSPLPFSTGRLVRISSLQIVGAASSQQNNLEHWTRTCERER